jgi:hypothetical protein
LAACWGHTRRKFYDVHEATASPIAAEALRRIAELYAIETSGWRPTLRAYQAAALFTVAAQGIQTSDRALDCIIVGKALCRFVDDGRVFA